MTTDTDPTKPDASSEPIPPPGGHEEAILRRVLGEVIAEALKPLESRLDVLQGSLGVTNGQSRTLHGRVTDLEERVGALEGGVQ